jgi:hypothetical protein
MGKTGQNKQRLMTGRPTVATSVCAALFVQAVRMHTDLNVIVTIKEAAP